MQGARTPRWAHTRASPRKTRSGQAPTLQLTRVSRQAFPHLDPTLRPPAPLSAPRSVGRLMLLRLSSPPPHALPSPALQSLSPKPFAGTVLIGLKSIVSPLSDCRSVCIRMPCPVIQQPTVGGGWKDEALRRRSSSDSCKNSARRQARSLGGTVPNNISRGARCAAAPLPRRPCGREERSGRI